MIIQSTFLVDEKNHESMPFSSPGFPYICFYDDMDMFPDKTVAWHWHTSCEIKCSSIQACCITVGLLGKKRQRSIHCFSIRIFFPEPMAVSLKKSISLLS